MMCDCQCALTPTNGHVDGELRRAIVLAIKRDDYSAAEAYARALSQLRLA